QLRERGSLESTLAGQDFVEDEAERINIASDADIAAGKLLRGHVGRRSGSDFRTFDVRSESGKSKIRDANLAGSVEHYVCGLQIAVDHTSLVGRRKTRADLPRDFRRLVLRKPADPANDRSEIFSIDVLHRQEESSVNITDVKYAANVRMRNLPGGAYFGVKSCQRGGILRKRFRQEL